MRTDKIGDLKRFSADRNLAHDNRNEHLLSQRKPLSGIAPRSFSDTAIFIVIYL